MILMTVQIMSKMENHVDAEDERKKGDVRERELERERERENLPKWKEKKVNTELQK